MLLKLVKAQPKDREEYCTMSNENKVVEVPSVITGSDRVSDNKITIDDSIDPPAVVVSKQPFLEDYQTVSEAYEGNAWFRNFFYEILEMYGCPSTSAECQTQTDRLLYSWGVLHTTSAVRKFRNIWITFYESNSDPQESAEFFARTTYDISNIHLIPRLPTPEEEAATSTKIRKTLPKSVIKKKKGKSDE